MVQGWVSSWISGFGFRKVCGYMKLRWVSCVSGRPTIRDEDPLLIVGHIAKILGKSFSRTSNSKGQGARYTAPPLLKDAAPSIIASDDHSVQLELAPSLWRGEPAAVGASLGDDDSEAAGTA